MKETLRIKQITDTWKSSAKEGNIHNRRVEISDTDGKFKVIFNNDFGDLPSKIRKLDEDTDLDAEVDVEIQIILVSRQKKITDEVE